MTRAVTNPRRVDTRRRRTFQPRAEALEGRRLLTAGDLDPTFGTGGYVLTSPRVESQSAGYSSDAAFGGVEVQPDGKILVAGSSSKTTGTGDWGVVRLTPSGALDPTFGSGGRVLTTFALNDSTTQSSGTALQPDGKLVVAGMVIGSRTTVNRFTTITDYDFGVVRYLPSGALDPSFGPNGSGKVITNFSSPQAVSKDFPNAVALQPDGKILVGGYSNPGVQQPSMVRYNADGTLDPTFGVGGKVLATLSGVSSGVVKDFEFLPDGKILVLGNKFLARYNTNGSLDTTFGTGGTGFTVPDLGARGTLGMQSMVVQADGGIVAGGGVSVGTDQNLALVRFTPAGVFDTSFAGTGAFIRDLGGTDLFSNKGLRLQADGKIVAAGLSYNTPDRTVAARFLPDGSLDTTFGTGGLVVRGFGAGGSSFNAAALQPDGKLVAVGHGYSAHGSTTDNNFLVVRYLGDPAPPQAASAALRGTTTPSLGSSRPEETILTTVSAPALIPGGQVTSTPYPLRNYLRTHQVI
jgi:uncharacterized delta-60 repeat protein